MKNIAVDGLIDYLTSIFSKAGLNDFEAFETAHHLVQANLRGIESHGVQRVAIYLKRLQKGLTAQDVKVEIIKETPVSAWIDAKNGIGQSVARQALDIGMQKAQKSGVGIIGMFNANHTGMLAYYTEMAAQNDLIAFSTTNAPSNMAPFGGKEKYFGTNPFSFSFPAGNEPPFILDMATSVVAKGKIILAMKHNQPIPLGWAIDREGNPTTNAKDAFEGLVLPLGGPKGYALAFMVDIFSGILTGASWGPHISDLYQNFEKPQNVGQFFYLMCPDLFLEMDQFKQRMDQAIQEVRSVAKAQGVERIYIPGEMENEVRNKRLIEGIPLSDELQNELRELGNQYGLGNEFSSLILN